MALDVGVHQVLEGQEPDPVGLCLAQHRHGLAPKQAPEDPFVRREFTDAVDRPRVQAVFAVRLCLQPDTHVLDRPREDGIGHSGEGAGAIELRIGERSGQVGVGVIVCLFESTPSIVKASELHRDTSANTNQRC